MKSEAFGRRAGVRIAPNRTSIFGRFFRKHWIECAAIFFILGCIGYIAEHKLSAAAPVSSLSESDPDYEAA